MTTILLIRHASHGLLGNVLVGRTPGVSLSEAGRIEAEQTAETLRGLGIAAVYTSPQPRAQETAAPLSRVTGLEAIVESLLDEIDFGDWTGQSFAALDPQPAWQRWNAHRSTSQTPGGESMQQAQERINSAIARAAQEFPNATIAMVSHCDIIKAALMDVLQLSLDEFFRFEISPASISTISVNAGERKVLRINALPRSGGCEVSRQGSPGSGLVKANP